jgi:uncharacterized protein (DUF3084 family)
MSLFTVLTVLFLLILGGVIAWAGDVIGYRLGKSRRSLFGLRPRITARLIGVAFGAALPIFGLLVAALGSNQVRLALFHLDELAQQQVELKQSNDALTSQLGSARETAQQATNRSRALTAEMRDKENSLKQVRAGLEQVHSSLSAAYANLNRVQSESATLRGQVSGLRQARDKLGVLVGQMQTRYADLLTKYKKAGDDLKGAEAALADVKQENGNLRAKDEELRTRIAGLQKQIPELKSQAETYETQIQNANRQLAHAQEEMDRVEKDLWSAQQKLGVAEYHAGHPLTDKGVLLEQGQELVRAFVDADQTQAQMESTLFELLLVANKVAVRHGVAVPKDEPAAVRVVGPMPEHIPAGEKPTQDAMIAEAARLVRGGPDKSYVVRILVARRSFEGDNEPADVAFVSAPYRLAFKAGATVWSAQVDGSQSRVEAFARLWGLIPKTREAAQAAGMIPNPETGQYGEAPAQQLLDALDKVMEIKGLTIVRAVAQRDTYTADSLVIDLQVSPARPEGARE